MTERLPPVRFWADFDLVRPTNTVHFATPFWAPAQDFAHTSRRRRDLAGGWWQSAADHYSCVPLEDSEIAVLPFAWEDTLSDTDLRGAAEAFTARAAGAGRATVVFCHHDRMLPVDLPETVVLRPSVWRSRMRETDVVIPGWVPDPLDGGVVQPLPRAQRPAVGFCGFAPPLGVERPPGPRGAVLAAKRVARDVLTRVGAAERVGVVPSLLDRVDALRRLEADARIDTDFVFRAAGFVAGEAGFSPAQAGLAAADYRRGYVGNLLRNPYTLAVRGFGNFSFRFYEALAAGRVPVVVDTDLQLPLADTLPWQELAVVVPRQRRRAIADALVTDLAGHDDESWQERQVRCRQAWTDALSMPAFFADMHRRLACARRGAGLVGRDPAHRIAAALQPHRTPQH